jgi:hypothetical protein
LAVTAPMPIPAAAPLAGPALVTKAELSLQAASNPGSKSTITQRDSEEIIPAELYCGTLKTVIARRRSRRSNPSSLMAAAKRWIASRRANARFA